MQNYNEKLNAVFPAGQKNAGRSAEIRSSAFPDIYANGAHKQSSRINPCRLVQPDKSDTEVLVL